MTDTDDWYLLIVSSFSLSFLPYLNQLKQLHSGTKKEIWLTYMLIHFIAVHNDVDLEHAMREVEDYIEERDSKIRKREPFWYTGGKEIGYKHNGGEMKDKPSFT